jgi:hypothetical protein
MKIVKISGGIGNQLFQYSFGRYLEEKYQVKVAFDIDIIHNNAKIAIRAPLIKELVQGINLLREPYCNRPVLYRVKRKIIHDYLPNFSEIYVENLFKGGIDSLNPFNKKRYFDGYWQSLIYINLVKEKLRCEINFDKNLTEMCFMEFVNISQSNSCSIHIRRGDYLLPHNSKLFAECEVNYFLKAINYILNINPDTVFFIFSDDIEWAKKIFVGPIYSFIDRFEDRPLIDLFLMSNCKNNIISNSTFSWWASWLNVNKNKIIISPKKWFIDVYRNEIVIQNLTDSSYTLI